jgi:hypothetical protein
VLRQRELQGDRIGLPIASSTGQQGNRSSLVQSISGDGRFVTFLSSASNFVADDTNGVVDLFLHDRQTGSTTRFNLTTDGRQATCGGSGGGITADGRFLIYGGEAPAATLPRPVDCGEASVCPVTIVRDRETGVATVLSTLWLGVPADFMLVGEQPYLLEASGSLISIHQQIANRRNSGFIINGECSSIS